jgi:predicted SAM-dependent methyltransferase
MVIDFGAGPNPRSDANIFVDAYKWRDDYIVLNFLNTPYPFENNSSTKIYFCDVIEHITIFEIDKVLKEFHRILKPNGILEITTPNLDWIIARMYKKDWKEHAIAPWLNQYSNDNLNALSYLFGGFYNQNEYNISGMGHVCSYNLELLRFILNKNNFTDISRIPDMRNDIITSDAILRIVCTPNK